MGNHGNKMMSTKDDDYYYCYYYYFYSYYSGSNILNNNGTSDHGGMYMYNVKICPCVHNDCYGMIMDLEERDYIQIGMIMRTRVAIRRILTIMTTMTGPVLTLIISHNAS